MNQFDLRELSVCLDCRSVIDLTYRHHRDSHRVVSLAEASGRAAWLRELWGSDWRERQHDFDGPTAATRLGTMLKGGFLGATAGGISGFVAGALWGLAYPEEFWDPVGEMAPRGARRLFAAMPQRRYGGVAVATGQCVSPVSGRACIAYCVETWCRNQRRRSAVLRVGWTCGFRVEVPAGPLIEVPRGPMRLSDRQPREVGRTVELRGFLLALFSSFGTRATLATPYHLATEAVLQNGDVVTVSSERIDDMMDVGRHYRTGTVALRLADLPVVGRRK